MDGCEALEMIRARRPDLALLDRQMPGLNGIELLAMYFAAIECGLYIVPRKSQPA